MSDKEKNLYFFYWDPQHLKQGGYADDFLWSSMGLKKNYGDRVILVNINEDSDLRSKLTRQLDLLIVEDDLAPMNKIVKAAMETRDVNEIGICFLADGLKFLVEKDISPKIMTLDFQMEGGELSKDVLESTKKFIEELEKKSAWKSTVILGISSHANEPVAQELENIIRASGFSIYPKTDALYTLLPHLLDDALSIHTLRLRSKAEGHKEGLNEIAGEARKKRTAKLPEYLVGQSESFMEAIKLVWDVADTNASVRLIGETGVGKEVFARYIVESSKRKNKPFIKIDCGSITNKELMPNEFFGHVKGAFAGADKDKNGYLHKADKGTLFLDEIAELTLEMQVRLLRVIQEKTFYRVGKETEETIDIRLIVATNKGLEEMVEKGEFREDLFYRINVYPVEIPSLRERREDIPLLAPYIINNKSKEIGKKVVIDEEALKLLENLDYQGNIRDLENLIERVIIRSRDGKITVELIKDNYRPIKGNIKSSSSDVGTKGTWFSELDFGEIKKLCKDIWDKRNETGESNILFRSPSKKDGRGRNHPDEIPRVIKAECLSGSPEHYIKAVLALFWYFLKESKLQAEKPMDEF